MTPYTSKNTWILEVEAKKKLGMGIQKFIWTLKTCLWYLQYKTNVKQEKIHKCKNVIIKLNVTFDKLDPC